MQNQTVVTSENIFMGCCVLPKPMGESSRRNENEHRQKNDAK